MKRSVLGFKKAFTLIEVMIAVMIVSIVIAALFKLRGDTNHLFSRIQQEQKKSTYATLILWNDKYGFNKEDINMYRLVDNFELDNDTRRELKNIKAKVRYSKIKSIDLDTLVIEIGKTELLFDNIDIHFNRVITR